MRIALGADHGGLDIKNAIKNALVKQGMDVVDLGTDSQASVDYPDYAAAVASRVANGEADEGVLVCTTGIGMSITANRYPHVRAALCLKPEMAIQARQHNNANVLVLGGAYVSTDEAIAILEAWNSHAFSQVDRHARRVNKVEQLADAASLGRLRATDTAVFDAIQRETRRQQETLCLIASENYVSAAVREPQGTVLTNKYAEGYPRKRWYNGCEEMDVVEQLAIDRAKALFGAEHVNVQPHSGSSANIAVYLAVLEAGDTILAMNLAHGGHLTHGHELNVSGRFYNIVPYGVDRETETINYDALAIQAKEAQPKLIIAGASAYSRELNFDRFREIADSVGALLMVDMAHIAGLVAGGAHPSPFPVADIVTTTTHKTLRGPRSGMILCREPFAAAIDRAVFPGTQGGPLMHTIASKAVCFHEALQPDFKDYAHQVVRNAQAMAGVLGKSSCRLISGGTDNHLLLVDVTPLNLTGKVAAAALEQANIVANKNCIPFDTNSPFVTSGVRLGTPGITTRGMREPDVEVLAELILRVLTHADNEVVLADVKRSVLELANRFPAP